MGDPAVPSIHPTPCHPSYASHPSYPSIPFHPIFPMHPMHSIQPVHPIQFTIHPIPPYPIPCIPPYPIPPTPSHPIPPHPTANKPPALVRQRPLIPGSVSEALAVSEPSATTPCESRLQQTAFWIKKIGINQAPQLATMSHSLSSRRRLAAERTLAAWPLRG